MSELDIQVSIPVLDEPDFQDFIKVRQIREEDFHIIEELATLPKNIFLENHNTFSDVMHVPGETQKQLAVYKKIAEEGLKSDKDLESRAKLENTIKYCSLMTNIANNYDGTTCYALNGRFERRDRKLWPLPR